MLGETKNHFSHTRAALTTRGHAKSKFLSVKTCHPGSAARFDPNNSRHHHLVCLDCGSIMDVEDARFNNLLWPEVPRLSSKSRITPFTFEAGVPPAGKSPIPLGSSAKPPRASTTHKTNVR